jgi:hypothetical protein
MRSGTRRVVGGMHPVREAVGIRRDAEVPVGASKVESLADEAHGARICLQETEIGMAGDGELRVAEFRAELRQIDGGEPGRGDDYV